MRSHFVRGFALGCGFALAGCAENAAAPAASAPAAAAAPADASAGSASVVDDEASASLAEHHRHHHAAGVTHFVAMALDTLGADEAKKPQILQLQADLNAQLAPAHAAEKELMNVLADGIAAGAVDKAKADDAITKLSASAGTVHDATADTLNKLHALLSPTERAALVEKVRAHWAVWRKVNHEAEPGGKEKGGRLATLAEELNLTPDQQEKISAGLKTSMSDLASKFDKKKAEDHVEAFATAFASDTFDAKTLGTTAGANGHLAEHGAMHMALFYETVAPVLTPEQRTKLADHMHEHLDHQQANAGK